MFKRFKRTRLELIHLLRKLIFLYFHDLFPISFLAFLLLILVDYNLRLQIFFVKMM